MNKRAPYLQKTGIQLIEEAMYLLRVRSAKGLLLYYTGSLPFVLGLLYFWSDMTRSAYAYLHCAVASLALAFLFIWMKCWQTASTLHLKSLIGNGEPVKWNGQQIFRLIMAQTIIQPTGLLILPLSFLAVLPFGWTFAFYQNTAAYDFNEPLSIKSAFHNYARQAKLWPGQNHIFLLILLLFSLFVFLNIVVAIFILPYILKKLLGIDTVFTLSGLSIFNTTFFAISCAATYLCVDPIIKIAYTLRCFYGASLKSGEDLKADFKHTRLTKTFIAMIVAALLLHPAGRSVMARETAHPPALQSISLSPAELDRSIQDILKKSEFSWRMPREKIIDDTLNMPRMFNPFKALLNWAKPYLKQFSNYLNKLLEKIQQWLKNLIPETDPNPSSTNLDWMNNPQILFFIFLCAATCVLAIYLRRLWLRKKMTPADTSTSADISSPDLSDDNISAEDLPVDRWLTLARELAQQGSFRLSLRALYLAILASLAHQEMILIAKHKSNRDYEAELKRRAHEHKDIIHIFSSSVRFFDRAWYGMADVTLKDVDLFSSNLKRITAFAKHQ